ncbi:hypothetical protein ONZ45_g18809 [Pleurotus djamor]|nr:hypothetical protein ONZ45_g18809 [Pleurotus djamor]
MSDCKYTTPRWAQPNQRNLLHRYLPRLQHTPPGPERTQQRKRLLKRWAKKWTLDKDTTVRIDTFIRYQKPKTSTPTLDDNAATSDDNDNVMESSHSYQAIGSVEGPGDVSTRDDNRRISTSPANMTLPTGPETHWSAPSFAIPSAGAIVQRRFDPLQNTVYTYVPVPGHSATSIDVALKSGRMHITSNTAYEAEGVLEGCSLPVIDEEVAVAPGVSKDVIDVSVKNGMVVIQSPIEVQTVHTIEVMSPQ